MPDSIQINLNTDNNRWLKALDKEVNQALKYTVSDIARAAVAISKETLSSDWHYSKQRQIPISQKLNGDGLSALVTAKGKGTNLFEFNAIQDTTGVSATLRTEVEKPHAFIIGKSVVMRSGKDRFPIKSIEGVTTWAGLFGTDWIRNIIAIRVNEIVDESFTKRLKTFVL